MVFRKFIFLLLFLLSVPVFAQFPRWDKNYIFKSPLYSKEAAALFLRMDNPPSRKRMELINDLIIDLKDGGIWDKLDTFYMLAAHDTFAAKLNWKGSNYNLTAANSPAFTVDRGYTGNGSNAYLNTNYNPNSDGVNYQLNNAMIGVYVRNEVEENEYDIGAVGTYSTILNSHFAGTILQVHSASTATRGNGSSSKGFSCAERISATTERFFKNGSQGGSNIALDSNGIPDGDIYILAYNVIGFGPNCSNRQISCAVIGSSLTKPEHQKLFNAVEIYLDAIGAGVVQ